MEVTIIQKFIHTSPRKLRLLADMARKIEPAAAMEVLRFTGKDAASDLSNALSAALAAAKQKGLSENLSFKGLEINEGPRMKRIRPGSRGRVKPYKRRMSHIKIVLSDDLNVKTKKAEVEEKKGEQTEVVVDKSAKSAE